VASCGTARTDSPVFRARITAEPSCAAWHRWWSRIGVPAQAWVAESGGRPEALARRASLATEDGGTTRVDPACRPPPRCVIDVKMNCSGALTMS